jgi:hypothetical protein
MAATRTRKKARPMPTVPSAPSRWASVTIAPAADEDERERAEPLRERSP